ncbi:twitching motility protein PilT [Sorangium cellulosum]|uniref:Ribonuclease VapC n=1 Tax=Sorangium cellulosum TaxID=56 RepID=A0A4V0NEV9_SORCE|nr:type II toxin-antitoxin system VapC family toxin [Sorangium cellulosum]AUX27532.1 twitching motility protein PilT [Sorangium cellulosum]
MKFLLDTNACIGHLTGRSPRITARLRTLSVSDVVLCSVVRAELCYGAHKSVRTEQNLEKLKAFFAPLLCLSFDDVAAEIYGRVRAELETRGTPIGPNDLLIAATALAHGLTLVTGNEREFGRVPGLRIENWES